MHDNTYSIEEFIYIFKSNLLRNGSLNAESYIPNSEFEKILNQSCSVCFILDFSTMKYIYISEGVNTIFGYDSADFLKEGLSFTFKILFPYEREILKKIHEEALKQYFELPISDRKKISFIFDHNLRTSSGKILRICHNSTFVEIDEKGHPLIEFGILTDISHLRKSGPSILTLKKDNEIISEVLIDSKEVESIFTKREKEIIQLLFRGLSSEQISEKFFISKETVYKHRKNMLLKTGCKNTIELLNFARSIGMS